MSQRSSDVPMLANFTIYIFPWDLLWTGWYHLKYIFSIDNNANQKSETFNKSQLSEFFDVPSRCGSYLYMNQLRCYCTLLDQHSLLIDSSYRPQIIRLYLSTGGDVCSRGGQLSGGGGCLLQEGSGPGGWRPPCDGYCCGRYASYWNAF